MDDERRLHYKHFAEQPVASGGACVGARARSGDQRKAPAGNPLLPRALPQQQLCRQPTTGVRGSRGAKRPATCYQPDAALARPRPSGSRGAVGAPPPHTRPRGLASPHNEAVIAACAAGDISVGACSCRPERKRGCSSQLRCTPASGWRTRAHSFVGVVRGRGRLEVLELVRALGGADDLDVLLDLVLHEAVGATRVSARRACG